MNWLRQKKVALAIAGGAFVGISLTGCSASHAAPEHPTAASSTATPEVKKTPAAPKYEGVPSAALLESLTPPENATNQQMAEAFIATKNAAIGGNLTPATYAHLANTSATYEQVANEWDKSILNDAFVSNWEQNTDLNNWGQTLIGTDNRNLGNYYISYYGKGATAAADAVHDSFTLDSVDPVANQTTATQRAYVITSTEHYSDISAQKGEGKPDGNIALLNGKQIQEDVWYTDVNGEWKISDYAVPTKQ